MEPIRSARINPADRRLDSTIEGLGVTAPPAMIAKKWGEGIVASGAFVPSVRVAGLERAARLAGESFGHEETGPAAPLDLAAFHPSRWLAWLAAGLAAVAGLLVLSTR
jgi:hypothetical protein